MASLIICAISNQPASANVYKVFGIGATVTCQTWLRLRQNDLSGQQPDSLVISTWAEGYLTAKAVDLQREVARSADYHELLGQVDKECISAPAQTFTQALDIVVANNTGTVPSGFVLDSPSPAR